MDRIPNDSRMAAYVPRNWRVITIAGATTIGMACSLAQPALAELWKTRAGKPAASAPKAVPAENGFTATIRRLMADSSRAAGQGDYAKAVQLAERAVKISEAASQLLGPTSECSPQQTARFLAEIRAGRDGSDVIASRPAPESGKSPARPSAQSATASSQPIPRVPIAAAPSLQQRPSNPAPVAPQRPASQPAPNSMAAAASVGTTRLDVKPANKAAPASNTGTKVPPRPAPAQSSPADELLAQSRVAAANGDLDKAIDLAEQAIEVSSQPSLFGQAAAPSSLQNSTRWLDRLIAQRDSEQNSAPRSIVAQKPAEQDVFEPPVRIASTQRRPASSSETQPDNPPAPPVTVPTAASETATPSETVDVEIPSEPVPAETPILADDSVWSEELPKAEPKAEPKADPAAETVAEPAAEPERKPLKFSRAAFNRSNVWDRSDEIDTSVEPVESAPTAQTDAEEAPAVTAETPNPTLDFPMRNAATAEPQSHDDSTPATPSDSDAPVVSSDDQPESPPVQPSSPPARPPFRLRGQIQQIAAEVAQPMPSPDTSAVEPIPSQKDDGLSDAPSPEADTPPELPVQRFPVQRVMQLRQRLENAAALNPGGFPDASQSQEHSARVQGDTWNSPAATSQTNASPASDAAPAAKLKLRTTFAPTYSTKENSDSPTEIQSASESAAPAKRPGLKLRDRVRMHLDDSIDETEASSAVPTRPAPARKPVVASSNVNQWSSADSKIVDSNSGFQAAPSENSSTSAQPKLTAPVSQVGFESIADANPTEMPASSGMLAPPDVPGSDDSNAAPPPPATPWFDGEPESSSSDVVVKKKSFALIDQLAAAFGLPVPTTISLMAGAGVVLIGSGLLAMRAAIRKRHTA